LVKKFTDLKLIETFAVKVAILLFMLVYKSKLKVDAKKCALSNEVPEFQSPQDNGEKSTFVFK
jgi:hypothetical protein